MEFFIWVLSQVFTVIEYALLGASYLAKSRKTVVALDIVSMICGIIAFVLLGADTGLVMSIIILVANFYYLWDESVHSKKERSILHVRDYVVLILVLGGILAASIWTYEGPVSLFSIAATTLYEISIWQKSTKVYKFIGIPVAGCWMIYNGLERSPFGVLCEMVMFTTSIVGYVREVKASKKPQRKKATSATKRKPSAIPKTVASKK